MSDPLDPLTRDTVAKLRLLDDWDVVASALWLCSQVFASAQAERRVAVLAVHQFVRAVRLAERELARDELRGKAVAEGLTDALAADGPKEG